MEAKQFKAVTLSTKFSQGRKELCAAFNDWVEDEQPASIVHVHYFHDSDAQTRGYQIIYEQNSENGDS